MVIKTLAAKLLAKRVRRSMQFWMKQPAKTQQKVFLSLIRNGRKTRFGKDHQFKNITTYSSFKKTRSHTRL